MTTVPALPPSPAPVAGGLLAGPGAAASDGGAFAGLLGADAAGTPAGTPASVAAEPTAGPVTGEPLPGEAPAPLEDTVEDVVPGPQAEPSAAQIIVAAQVTPVGPMLANAPRLTPSYGEVAPAPPAEPAPVPRTPTKSAVLTPETALLVGHLGAPVAQVAGPAGQVVQGTLVEGPVVDGAVDTKARQASGADIPSTDGTPEPVGTAPPQGGRGEHPPGPQTGPQPGTPAENQPGTEAGTEAGTPPSEALAGGTPTSGPRTEVSAPGNQPTAAQTNAVTGLTATGPAAAATAPAPTTLGATPANPVAGQVFPEVTRLVSRGDGTRRITLQLSPEALGDVRVVLTVRGGEVQVRMSGGELAQQALLAGAPELHRLLDLAGATSSQIQVGTQSSQGPSNALDQTLDQHAQRQDARNDGEHTQNHRTAGTRDGDTSARDGAPRGTHPHPATNPGTRTRIAGVDVTM